MIDPANFIEKMTTRWTDVLGNIPNEPLKETWGKIAQTFNEHIKSHDDPGLNRKWSVLQPPTGSGKTQSVILYSAMMAGEEDHPGILIVTRRIADCDSIVEQINEIAGNPSYAIAYHSEATGIKTADLKDYAVVVITHKAFENALDYLSDDDAIRNTWPLFHDWKEDSRKLVVIDECIDITESYHVSLDGLRETLGAIPQKIRDKHLNDIGLIQWIVRTLEMLSEISNKYGKPVQELMTVLPDSKALQFDKTVTDVSGLIDDGLKEIVFDSSDSFKNDQARQKHVKRLKDLQYVLRSANYYSGQNNDITLRSSRLLVPGDVKGAVILDATAETNVIYELHEDSQTIEIPPGTRNYRNVTLHVSKGHNVGKTSMIENAKKVTSGLVAELSKVVSGDTLVICHKGVEPILIKHDTPFNMFAGHWGDIDGSNEWKDCGNVVIFGLPYRPEYWTADTFMALQGPTSTEWLRDADERSFGRHPDIRQALMNGQIITDVIQAINRVRCRKTIDAEGNCDETHVYILLPKGALAEDLEEGIKRQMPGIQVMDWDYTGKTKSKPKASKHEASLIKYIESMESGIRELVNSVGKKLGISTATMGRLKKKITDQPESDLKKTMDSEGVILENLRSGRSTKTYFLKGDG